MDSGGVSAMPHNLEAEQALLGSLMFDNAVFERLSDRLRGSHFYEPFHQRLYDAVEDHIRQGMLAEPTILMERFKQDPAFQEFGGLRYLADLVDRAPPAANAPDYARVVYDLALRRDLIRIGGEIIKEAPIPKRPPTNRSNRPNRRCIPWPRRANRRRASSAFPTPCRARFRWRQKPISARASWRAWPPD